MKTQANTRTADAAIAQHNTAQEELVEAILGARSACFGGNWTEAETAAHIRARLAEVAFAAGAITEEQAAEHGATV
jgi:hypothetical protein